ncbi:type II toxin-antitoxin system HipA family toxin [Cyanobium sp. ATX 6F1]|uniref:type II toxin-antitoxin system HipA family toxin n=1 Tax=Cyanobium sp. ATX 6F1 TaxID=2823702 RepID=UPI0020CEEB41|nr:type II toxin-antitoxin system HipA family toxin [Cyanobium sp. ATX 6F1]MCP9917463.1 type II toxin-antitoxin system HipA family toxin [Cyanobium sp. ATX 6F1]
MNGELVGHWQVTSTGGHRLHYAASWLSSPRCRPISLSLPLLPEGQAHHGAVVENYFENLLPDSREIRLRLQERFSTSNGGAMALLAAVGRDCVGALQLLPEGSPALKVRVIEAEPLDEAGVARQCRLAVQGKPLGQNDGEAFRLSLAGAQEKTAFLRHGDQWCVPLRATPSTHIFKLPLGRVGVEGLDRSLSIENEWLCGRIAAAFGLPVAASRIACFEDQKVLVVERFDRRLARDGSWWLRLPQEDCCQALGIPPGLKYQSDGGPGIADLMTLLRGSLAPQEDRMQLFRSLLLFWLLAAIDGHAKNFSLMLGAGGAFRLTPLYDVISAYPVIGRGANQLAPQRVTMARQWGIDPQAATQAMVEMVTATTDVMAEVTSTIPAGFPSSVADPILGGLEDAAQRLSKALDLGTKTEESLSSTPDT